MLSPSTPLATLFESQNQAVRMAGKGNSAGSGPPLGPISQSVMRGLDLNWLDNRKSLVAVVAYCTR
ncbi:uncharacterized protein PgNI_03489 [Pyricularia grisea]|uniref:Uncharacterized protein n=1 Tax=Pyricularia grisea TaxID=148305 RepID=A0A6P8BDZ8_PYRGI|nr:uncharacterized protein PgNI_03489 [Pyricularia grisea]TLD14043.1 hypothetical protein PgNI_03489 [Pyricularia grisea]